MPKVTVFFSSDEFFNYSAELSKRGSRKKIYILVCPLAVHVDSMNINLYRRRRLRSTQPILTRVQIRDLGRLIDFTSFRKSVEFFMVLQQTRYFSTLLLTLTRRIPITILS